MGGVFAMHVTVFQTKKTTQTAAKNIITAKTFGDRDRDRDRESETRTRTDAQTRARAHTHKRARERERERERAHLRDQRAVTGD